MSSYELLILYEGVFLWIDSVSKRNWPKMCVYFEHNIIMSIRISEENKYTDYIPKI